MIIINEWDWKFRIGIFKKTNIEVKSKIDKYMTMDEKKIYNYLFSYHIERISLLVILDTLIANKYSTWDETGMFSVATLCKRVLPICDKVQKYVDIKLNQALNNNQLLKKEIMKVYKAAINKSSGSLFEIESVFRKILGENYFKKVIYSIQYIDELKIRNNKEIKVNDMKKLVLEIARSTSLDKNIINKFGKSLVDNYDIKVVEGDGFAEWWDRQLINKKKDLLILYNNKDLRNINDFEYTIYHEVYPGHGQFYNYIRENSDNIQLLDQGAITLIEGWATYCEWYVKKSEYSMQLINRAKKFLLISLSNNYSINQKINVIYENSIKVGYSHEQALNTVINFSQYPTFIESYYLGAFCIKEIVDYNKIKPIDFLQGFKEKKCGELFALWQ